MTHNSKKLCLCANCQESDHCLKPCNEAIQAEKEDNSTNYQSAADYKAKGTSTTFYDMRRHNGGINRFK